MVNQVSKVNFIRLNAVPEGWLPDSIYFIKNYSLTDPIADLYITDMSGNPLRVGNINLTQEQIATFFHDKRVFKIFDNIAQRDQYIQSNPDYAQLFLVVDASDDPNVTSNSAFYGYRPAFTGHNAEVFFISDFESQNISLSWGNIENRPSSTVQAIDLAVANYQNIYNNLASLTEDFEDVQLLANANQLSIAQKADQTDLEELENTVTGQGLVLVQKADQSAVSELDAAVNSFSELVNSKNLFDPAKKQTDKYINSSTGVIQAASGWACVTEIAVTAGQSYTLSWTGTRRNGWAFYSDSGTLIGTVNSGTTSPITLTAPVGAATTRFNLNDASGSVPSNVQLEVGSTATAYQAYTATYRRLKDSAMAANAVTLSQLTAASTASATDATNKANNALTASQVYTDLIMIEGSKNLFNATTIRDGWRISSSGNLGAVAAAQCSADIAVEAGQTYTISAVSKPTGVTFFDAGRTVLLYNASIANPLTLTAPAGATAMVVNVKKETDGAAAVNLQVERGSAATAYQAFSSRKIIRNSAVPDHVVTTANVVTASAKNYDIKLTSKNLFSEQNVVLDSYLNNSGQVSGATGWARTGLISVTPGQVLTLSGTRGRHGVAFYATTDMLSPLQYIPAAGLPLTMTVPAGAAYIAFNLQSATFTGWSNIQLEVGSAATDYIPYGQSTYRIDGNAVINLPPAVVPTLGTFTGGATQQTIKGVQGNDTVLHTVSIAAAASHSNSRVFNWVSTSLNGVTLHACGDDAAPYRINGTTIGANHGYSRSILTMTAHGKTSADIGSVWVDNNSKEWVIVGIDTANTLSVTSRLDNTAISTGAGTLMHVSGANNTVAINWTLVTASQWYPAIKKHRITVTADGRPIDPTSTTPVQFERLAINQSYELGLKESMVEWLIANKGSDYTEYGGVSNVSVSMTYVFDKYGNCTGTSDFMALDTVVMNPASAGIMIHQTARLTPGIDGNVLYYMPKALPLVHEGTSYDFAAKADVSTFAPSTRLDMTPDRCVSTGHLLSRVVQLTNNWGYASGYLPVLSAGPDVRRTLASRKALQLNESQAKIYFSLVDSAAITTLNAGAYYSAIFYRNYFRRPLERTNSYMVLSEQGDFLFCDWHVATTDRVHLPAELTGRAFTVVEKSDTVTVLSGVATGSVAFKTTGAGYAILAFKARNTGQLSAVASSGSYTDLINKPTSLSIQQLTKVQYDALTTAQKNDTSILYVIVG